MLGSTPERCGKTPDEPCYTNTYVGLTSHTFYSSSSSRVTLTLPLPLSQALLFEPEAQLSAAGALVVHSGGRTGRSPSDKRLVKDAQYQDQVWWGDGSPNHPTDIR